jgi:hypothetical protein
MSEHRKGGVAIMIGGEGDLDGCSNGEVIGLDRSGPRAVLNRSESRPWHWRSACPLTTQSHATASQQSAGLRDFDPPHILRKTIGDAVSAACRGVIR